MRVQLWTREGFASVDLEALRDFATRYTAAWCSQDAASVAGFFEPEGRLTVNSGALAIGRAAITEVAREFMTAFPDLLVAMEDVLPSAEGVRYSWILTGTTAGKHVRIGGYEIWRLGKDGLIAESDGHFDSDDYDRQLHSEASGAAIECSES